MPPFEGWTAVSFLRVTGDEEPDEERGVTRAGAAAGALAGGERRVRGSVGGPHSRARQQPSWPLRFAIIPFCRIPCKRIVVGTLTCAGPASKLCDDRRALRMGCCKTGSLIDLTDCCCEFQVSELEAAAEVLFPSPSLLFRFGTSTFVAV